VFFIRTIPRIACLSPLFIPLVSAQTPTDSLQAYFPFNGNAQDATGKGHNGTASGATLTDDRFGNPNSAYLFNGTTDYIGLITTALLKPAAFPVSVSARIKTGATGSNQPFFIGQL